MPFSGNIPFFILVHQNSIQLLLLFAHNYGVQSFWSYFTMKYSKMYSWLLLANNYMSSICIVHVLPSFVA